MGQEMNTVARLKRAAGLWVVLLATVLLLPSCGGDGKGAMPATGIDESPFGFLDVPPDRFDYYEDIGVRWLELARENERLGWGSVEKTEGVYDFSEHDASICGLYSKGMNVIYVTRPINPLYGTVWVEGDLAATDEYPDGHLNKWANYINALVERYDGDGIEDAPCPSAIKIKYYQLVHELLSTDMDYWQNNRDQYAEVFETTYRAMKSKCGDCVLTVPVPFLDDLMMEKNFLSDVLGYLEGSGLLDVGFDYHAWSVDFGTPPPLNWQTKGEDYRVRVDFITKIKDIAFRHGFDSSHIISLESGMAATEEMEADQAGYVVRSYVSGLAHGQEKQFWTTTVEYGHKTDENMFTHMGIVHNPVNDDGLSHKKLAYYAYKKMVELLEGSDWNGVSTVQESGNVYVYRFRNNGRDIYVAWWDYFDDPSYVPGMTKAFSISGLQGETAQLVEAVPMYDTGAAVVDYASAFRTETLTVSGGSVTVSLGENPVYLEANQ